MKSNNSFIIVSGPTGVGKTDYVDKLIEKLQKKSGLKHEIINADIGQFYKPISIGTAKPDLSNSAYKQHLFDIIDEPKNFSVSEYKSILTNYMSKLWKKNIVPVLVGGSLFYIKSIFFTPEISEPEMSKDKKKDEKDDLVLAQEIKKISESETSKLYEKLIKIDKKRAREIHINDRYRTERALILWLKTGIKPSELKPKFKPFGNCSIYFLTREREELYDRINKRVYHMFRMGWIEEVENLDENWKNFLKNKSLIGYPEIINYLNNLDSLSRISGKSSIEKSKSEKEISLIEEISAKTRAYAKRQLTFWKSFNKLLKESDPDRICIKEIREINLTASKI